MITILELLNILESKFDELSWSICPNLELGILSTNTFEISKKPQKLQTLFQKLSLKKLELTEKESSENQKIEERIKENTNFNADLGFNPKNPIEIATVLSEKIQKYLEKIGIKSKMQTTGAYLNLDLENVLWQEFLN